MYDERNHILTLQLPLKAQYISVSFELAVSERHHITMSAVVNGNIAKVVYIASHMISKCK